MNPTPSDDLHARAQRIARERNVSLFDARTLADREVERVAEFARHLDTAERLLAEMSGTDRADAVALLTQTSSRAFQRHVAPAFKPAPARRPSAR